MYTLTFIVAGTIFFISGILYVIALLQQSRDNTKGRGLMTTGFSFWLVGIIAAAVLFGVFSV
jgi:uncharacterized membrane protein HdeD (DUF308 family)